MQEESPKVTSGQALQGVTGKVVVITGASSGIGEQTARTLVHAGARVVLGARREERLMALEQELGSDAIAWMPADVTKSGDMQALIDLAIERFGRVDVLFANAGIMPVSAMRELKVDEWDAMIDVNVRGVLYAMAAAIPVFERQDSGHVIVTSSTAGIRSIPGNAVYCGTKHFVRAMLDSFRSECVQQGNHIRSTLIYPGAIHTGLLNSITSTEARKIASKLYEQVGMGPEPIANAVLYAISQPEGVDVSDLVIRPSAEA